MRRFKTATAAAALCAALAACADFPKPQYPVRAPQDAPPPQPYPEPAAPRPAPPQVQDDAPQAAPTQSIQQQTLPPPAPRRGAAAEPRDDDGDRVLVYAAGEAVVRAAAAPDGDTVTLKKGDTLQKVAKAHGVPVEELAKLNGLKPPYRLTAGDSLKLPAKEKDKDKAKAEAAPAREKAKAASDEPPAKGGGTATVAKGDTLASIARKAGVKVEDLARFNGLKTPYRLKIGQSLALQAPKTEEPAPKAREETAKAKAPAAPEPGEEGAASTVTVRRHDTLQSLARQAKIPVETLARLNHLKRPYRLRPGQSIKLPDQAGPPAEPQTVSGAAPEHARAATVRAGSHDTLQSLASKAGVSVEELAAANHLKRPYRIRRGQVLQLPTRASLTSYRVQEGDTLYSIGRRFDADPKALAELNRIDLAEPLKVGQVITLPGGAEDRIAPRPGPAPERAEAAPAPPLAEPRQPVPYASLPPNPGQAGAPGQAPAGGEVAPVPTAPQPSAPSASATPAPYVRPAPPPEAAASGGTDADAAAAGKGVFRWPARGDVLSAFGPKTGGQRNDGIDIGGAVGDPVQAAAAGEVVYAGNSVPGFGNLVLIRHEGGWVTAYAHMAGIDVKMRQTVAQGQQIGEIGQTGGVDRPQLHFEVRYAASVKDKPRPIDPALVLPQ